MLELTTNSDHTLLVLPRHIVSIGPPNNNDPRYTRVVLVNGDAVEVKGNYRAVAQKVSESLGETIVRGPQ